MQQQSKSSLEHGILCMNKPQGYTSFDVIARLRGMLKIKRIGHAGTLDPMATGVLPIFVGNATKACDMLPDGDKEYLAGFALGVRTDTLDATGTVLQTKQSAVVHEQIEEVLEAFRGQIEQIPPMYSAVQVNGQRLYDLARQGIEVERKKRQVVVYELELTQFDQAAQQGSLRLRCSKGTYVRSIIADIGDMLGCGAMMTSLVRTHAAGFCLDDCITMQQAQELTQQDALRAQLRPIDDVFDVYPKICLNAVQSVKFSHGVKLDLNRIRYTDGAAMYRVYSHEKQFLGLASLDKTDMGLKIEKMFVLTPLKAEQ